MVVTNDSVSQPSLSELIIQLKRLQKTLFDLLQLAALIRLRRSRFFATQMTGRRNGECEPLVSELKNWQRPIP
jgi:hypothetical protein